MYRTPGSVTPIRNGAWSKLLYDILQPQVFSYVLHLLRLLKLFVQYNTIYKRERYCTPWMRLIMVYKSVYTPY
jgi:hypothetical protein